MADWAEKNRAYFNEAASTYNRKFSKTILQIIEEIQERREWIGVDWVDDNDDNSDDDDDDHQEQDQSTTSQKPIRLLDYACGTGLVSRALAPYVTQCIGIDISSSMVAEYNAGASNQGIPEGEMRAVMGNLIDASSSSSSAAASAAAAGAGVSSPEDASSSSLATPEFFNFDIAAVGMGWHHFADPGLAAKRLAERLRVGGVLLIIDFLPHGPHEGHSYSHGHSHGHGGGHEGGHGQQKPDDHAAAHTVTHLGFAEEDIKRMFEEAGVGRDFKHVVLGRGVVFEQSGNGGEKKSMRRSVFMARGTKV